MSEDLIRRSDAIKALAEYISCDYATEEMATESATLLIDTIPTIEPKRGRWINEHEDGHGSWVGTCDQCNKENHVDNFCPHCGADMGEREGE